MEQKYVRAIWNWAWLLVLVTLLAGLGTFAIGRSAPPVYEAEARLIVGPGLESPLLDLDTLRASGQLLQTYANIAQTPSFQQELLGRLALDMNEAELSEAMDVVAFNESQILMLRVRHQEPQLAIAIVNLAAQMIVERSPTSQGRTAADLMDQMQIQATDLENEITASRARITELETELASARTAARQEFLLARLIEERRFLTDSNVALNNLYDLLREPVTNQVQFIESAQSAYLADSTLNLMVLIGAMAGFIAALILILAIAYYNDPIYSAAQLEKATNLPVLASVPLPSLFKRITKQGADPQTALRQDPASETYRAVAAKLMQFYERNNMRSLLITSNELKQTTLPGEVAAGVATVLAMAGQRVLLVEGTWQQPAIRRLFALDSVGAASPQNVTQFGSFEATKIQWLPALSVLTLAQGKETSDTNRPVELFNAVERLSQQVDLVFITAPPVSTNSDGLFLAPRTDGVLLLAQSGNRRETAKETVSKLRLVESNLIGWIMVKARRGRLAPSRRARRTEAQAEGLGDRLTLPAQFSKISPAEESVTND